QDLRTLARMTYQRLFRRYLLLSGMTGTAREVAREVKAVYDLAPVHVPRLRPSRPTHLPARVFATAAERGRPVADLAARPHRAARQGDPGSSQAMVSLDDELFRVFAPRATRVAAVLVHWRLPGQAVFLALRCIAQAAAERRNARVRIDNMKLDKRLARWLAFT